MEYITWNESLIRERLLSLHMPSIYKKTGVNICRIRKGLNYTQEKLAELTFLDVKSIVNIELGKRNPTIKTLNKIAKILKVPIDSLLK